MMMMMHCHTYCMFDVCVQVGCKNKREGKQLAAQAVLQLMHSQLTTWGSLLRLYSKSSEVKEKKVFISVFFVSYACVALCNC